MEKNVTVVVERGELAEGARRGLQKLEKLLIVLPPGQHLQVPQSGKKLAVSGVELWSF